MAQPGVRVLEESEMPIWDALAAGSVQGTVFHSSDWLLANAALLDQTLVFLGCFEEGELIGGCPLLLSNPYNALKVASSTAISIPYGGMVISGLENSKQRRRELHSTKVTVSILEYIVSEKFDYVNLVNSPGFQDIRPFTREGWSPKVYYTYMLPLEGDILKNTSKDVRQKVRKAQKLGIQSAREFDPGMFWDLMVRTFVKQGKKPPFSKGHLAGLLNLIKEKGIGDMWVARTSAGEVAAAEVFLWDQKMAHGWTAASAEEHLSTGAVSLLLYDIFTDLKDRNHPMINLMSGNTTQLSSFISSFNPLLVPYYGVEFTGLKYSILKRMKGR